MSLSPLQGAPDAPRGRNLFSWSLFLCLYSCASSACCFGPFSADGASIVGGPRNAPGQGVSYASLSYAGAMLECLAHSNIGWMPRKHVAVKISMTGLVKMEQSDERDLPVGWHHSDLQGTRAGGDA